MSLDEKRSRWGNLADVVLCNLLTEGKKQNRYIKCMTLGISTLSMPAGFRRDMFSAITSLRNDDKPVTLDVVFAKMRKQPPSDFIDMAVQFGQDDLHDPDEFLVYLEEMSELSRSFFLIEVLQNGLEHLQKGEHPDIVFDYVSYKHLLMGQSGYDETTSAKYAERLKKVLSGKTQFKPYGIHALDYLAKGIFPKPYSYAVAVVARRKQGKTRFEMNKMLRMAKSGKKVMLLMLESTAEMASFMMQAMLTTQWFVEMGHYGKYFQLETEMPDGSKEMVNTPVSSVSPSHFIMYQKSWLENSRVPDWVLKLRREAIKYAMDEFAKLPIYILDKSQHRGRLSDPRNIDNAFHYASTANFDYLVVDNAQRWPVYGKSDYEKLKFAVETVEPLTRKYGYASCLISQAAARESTRDTSFAKGGGDLDDAMDQTMIVRHTESRDKSVLPPGVVEVELIHSRYTDSGGTCLLEVDPSTGWILNDGVSPNVDLKQPEPEPSSRNTIPF